MKDDLVKLCPHYRHLNRAEVYHCDECGNSLLEERPIPRSLAIVDSPWDEAVKLGLVGATEARRAWGRYEDE